MRTPPADSVFACRFVRVEAMEPRLLLSASAFANVNISRMPGSQSEPAIAIDRADPNRLFALSDIDAGDGLMAAVSSDAGKHWSSRLIANDADSLTPACCDPTIAFDSFGNLFASYLSSTDKAVVVIESNDAGMTFSQIAVFSGDVDQPHIAVGSGGSGGGSVWLTFQKNNQIVVAGAAVNGANSVSSFGALERVPGSGDGNFGDIAVGPAGEVIVTYQRQGSGVTAICTSVDADGLGPGGFARSVSVTNTRVGDVDSIPPQASRAIDAEAKLAWDRSGGPFSGRIYLTYTDELPAHSGNTDIFMRYSDTGGATWSSPIRINDDTGRNSQFFPRVSVDQTTGNFAVSWYDARNDLGLHDAFDTNGVANDDVEMYAVLGSPTAGGVTLSGNAQVGAGPSNAAAAGNDNEFGDYTGLDFFNGSFYPIWADNSNSTADNPNGTLKGLNINTARVDAGAFNTAAVPWLEGLAGPGPVPAVVLKNRLAGGLVSAGSAYTFSLTWNDAAGLDLASFTGNELQITGPVGFNQPARLLRVRSARRGTSATVTYQISPPSGHWTTADAGTYAISVRPEKVMDASGITAAGAILGNFVVEP